VIRKWITVSYIFKGSVVVFTDVVQFVDVNVVFTVEKVAAQTLLSCQ